MSCPGGISCTSACREGEHVDDLVLRKVAVATPDPYVCPHGNLVRTAAGECCSPDCGCRWGLPVPTPDAPITEADREAADVTIRECFAGNDELEGVNEHIQRITRVTAQAIANTRRDAREAERAACEGIAEHFVSVSGCAAAIRDAIARRKGT